MHVDKEAKLSRHRPDSSTDRVLGLLDLFTLDEPIWTVDMMVERHGLARATIYRYVKTLADTGFLAPVGEGGYALGPRFVEIDRQIRMSDPLLQIGPPVIATLREKVAGAQLLCRFYGRRVMCIYEDRTDSRIKSSFERGRPFSLFLGAPSKVILAHLPTHQLQRLFLYHPDEVSVSGLGASWTEFRDKLKAIRKAGFAVASDIDKALVGIAAPIFLTPDAVTGSICLVKIRNEVTDRDVQDLAKLAVAAGQTISERLQTSGTGNPVSKTRASKPASQKNRPRAAGAGRGKKPASPKTARLGRSKRASLQR